MDLHTDVPLARVTVSLMPAKAPELSELSEEHLNSLKRKDLLNLCKDRGIKCVGKNSELIEKLLELRTLSSAPSEPFETPSFHSNYQPTAPMTPQKKLDMCLPIVNTPGSSAVIKSIVQSARKTGLNSSPIRVPFALSPMAIRLQHAGQIQFSPVKSSVSVKEPSLPIKEAFLNNFDTDIKDAEESGPVSLETEFVSMENEFVSMENEFVSLPFDNKRPHDEDDQIDEEDGHQSKKEKLDQSEHEANERSECNDEIIDTVNNEVYNEYIEEKDSFTDSTTKSNNSFYDSNNSLADPSNNSLNTSNQDLFTDSRDPEFTSPELHSAIDSRVSRSEHQDSGNFNFFTANPHPPSSHIISKSSSTSSTKSNSHPLLPSGIIKLLEKKRQEKEQHQQQKDSHTFSTSANPAHPANKNKFDLKESLKRSLPYKPHTGSIKPNNAHIPKKDTH